MPWEGYNYEDAILISEGWFKKTFIPHIQKNTKVRLDKRSSDQRKSLRNSECGEDALRSLDESDY